MKPTPFARPDKPSVIFVLEASSISGGVQIIYRHANWLASHGWQVAFFTLAEKPAWFQLDTRIVWEQMMVYEEIEAALRYTPSTVLKVATWWRTAPYVARGCHGNEGCYFTQDIESEYYVNEAQKRTVENTYSLGLSIYSDSTYAQSWCEERGIPSEYVGLWLDEERFKYDPDTRYHSFIPTVMSLTRRQNLKGYDIFCEAARRLDRQLPVWSLVTFGRGTFPKVIARHNHVNSPTDQQVDEIYRQASLLLVTSRHEGTGMPILEAWLSGCPVVTTACDGNSFCVDGENTLVVPLGCDAAKGLADATLRLLRDKALSKRLAEAGYETAKRLFSYKVVAPRLEAYFNRRWQEIS